MVNGYAKRCFKCKFNKWYYDEVLAQLDNGVGLAYIKVNLQLFRLKSIHPGWIVKFFNNITTLKDQEWI